MKKKQNIQYTIRDIPEATNNRLREVAAEWDISLNQAVVDTLQRGLGSNGERVSYRRLRHLVSAPKELDRKAWNKTLAEMDQVHPDDWK
jgi:hypothetical protein